jgi:hypothetical protein
VQRDNNGNKETQCRKVASNIKERESNRVIDVRQLRSARSNGKFDWSAASGTGSGTSGSGTFQFFFSSVPELLEERGKHAMTQRPVSWSIGG